MLSLNETQVFPYSIPLYIQIAESLVNRIEAGELAPGERLPSERELSEKLGVNRMTLRRALRVLEAQGLVVRKHGVGTFVSEPKIDRPMDTLFRFTTGMQKRGFTPDAKVISVEQAIVDVALSKELAIPLSSSTYRIIRLRFINQEPVLVEDYIIPAQRFPGLDRHELEKRSIYEIMESEYGVSIVRARQSFEPVIASAFEAELLGLRAGAPLMLEKRISFDSADRPIEYGKDRYRGDRFRFVSEAAAPFDL